MSTHRTALRRVAQVSAIALPLAVCLLTAAILLHERHIDVDINSGRESRALSLGPLILAREPYDTPLSILVRDAGWQPPPPDWRRAHTQRSRTGARINHRYGGILSSAREIPRALELLSDRIPPADQHRLALTTIRCLQRGEKFIVGLDFDAPQIELLSEEGKLLESYPSQ